MNAPEALTILHALLRPAGYQPDVIADFVTLDFLNEEAEHIRAESSMHILGAKKALLYVTPVISPLSTKGVGIKITSAVASDVIVYDSEKNHSWTRAVAIKDEYRLIGVAFPARLVNHLSIDVFPWKHARTSPPGYDQPPVDLTHTAGVSAKTSRQRRLLFLIDPSFYESSALFNTINARIADRLTAGLIPALAASPVHTTPSERTSPLTRAPPLNDAAFLGQLNAALSTLVGPQFACAMRDVLARTVGWALFDSIALYGFDSAQVGELLRRLLYVKQERTQVRMSALSRFRAHNRLAWSMRIARTHFPHFFDPTDRRMLFRHSDRFSLGKLPAAAREFAESMVKKSVAAHRALLAANKCAHVVPMRAFIATPEDPGAFRTIRVEFLDSGATGQKDDGDDAMLPCRRCARPMLCPHHLCLHDALERHLRAAAASNDHADAAYHARRSTISKFRVANPTANGDSDRSTEALFTYYCRLCGGELGKSNDTIQDSIVAKMKHATASTDPDDPSRLAYMYISAAVRAHARLQRLPIGVRALQGLVFERAAPLVLDPRVVGRAKDPLEHELKVRLMSTVYALACLVALNHAHLKIATGILAGSASSEVKAEFSAALVILKQSAPAQRLGVGVAELKTTFVGAFKSMRAALASESFNHKARTARECFELDLVSSPVTQYAVRMYRYAEGRAPGSVAVDVAGIVDLDELYRAAAARGETRQQQPRPRYRNIYRPRADPEKEKDAGRRYALECYLEVAALAARGAGTAKDPVEPCAFAADFESARRKRLASKRHVPDYKINAVNSREGIFNLENAEIAYCSPSATSSARPHRWRAVRRSRGGKSAPVVEIMLVCAHCKREWAAMAAKASSPGSKKIRAALRVQNERDSFFERYALACPVKNGHEFKDDACWQCKITQEQLLSRDVKYYDKFKGEYQKHLRTVTARLMRETHEITSSVANPASRAKGNKRRTGAKEEEDSVSTAAEAAAAYASSSSPLLLANDKLKLESLATGLSQLHSLPDLQAFVNDLDKTPSEIQSYVQMFFAYYTFARNISPDANYHPDRAFYELAQKFGGKGALRPLPEPPLSADGGATLAGLFQIAYDLSAEENANAVPIVRFIISRILQQHTRRQPFDRGRLRAAMGSATTTLKTLDGSDEAEELQGDDESELPEVHLNLIDAFDIESDLEDNLAD